MPKYSDDEIDSMIASNPENIASAIILSVVDECRDAFDEEDIDIFVEAIVRLLADSPEDMKKFVGTSLLPLSMTASVVRLDRFMHLLGKPSKQKNTSNIDPIITDFIETWAYGIASGFTNEAQDLDRKDLDIWEEVVTNLLMKDPISVDRMVATSLIPLDYICGIGLDLSNHPDYEGLCGDMDEEYEDFIEDKEVEYTSRGLDEGHEQALKMIKDREKNRG